MPSLTHIATGLVAILFFIRQSTTTFNYEPTKQDTASLIRFYPIKYSIKTHVHNHHFHAVGAAQPTDSPAFNSSGGHYNPATHQHGLKNPLGTHAGDLPNLIVDSQGNGTLITTTNRISLTDGPISLFDSDGSSLIIH